MARLGWLVVGGVGWWWRWGAWALGRLGGAVGRRYCDMLAVSRPASDLLPAIVPLCFIASLVGSAAERARAAESVRHQEVYNWWPVGSGSGSGEWEWEWGVHGECMRASEKWEWKWKWKWERHWVRVERECGRRVRQRKTASAASPVALFVYFVLFLFSCFVQCVGRQC